jgi:23S rRNA (pseudouridine1915-N3)-methyltransferase
MEVALLAVGRLRPYYREACDDYLRRLRRYARIAEREVKEAAQAPTPVQQQEEEAARLLAGAPAGATLVALDLEGTAWSSEELAGQLGRWQLAARPVALIIGGSTGLSPELRRRAAYRWSLGPLTLPHELARVVVCEQMYRAFTILRGEPYHKGGRS